MFFVYLLYSASHDSFYIGFSTNAEKRLLEHNARLTKSTKAKAPWILAYVETLDTKTEAIKRERFLKKQKNKTFYKKLAGMI